MYAHQVIEDLNKMALINPDPGCKRFCMSIPGYIRKAQKFHSFDLSIYDQLAKNLAGIPVFTKEAADFRLPYPIMWIDYTASGDVLEEGQTRCPKRAGLLISIEERIFNLFVFAYAELEPIGPAWFFFPYKINIQLDAPSGRIAGFEPVLTGPQWYRKDTLNRHLADYNDDLAAINVALLLLNCKNIVTEQIHPDTKLQKARKKRGKLPLFSYHTLVIKPTGKRQASIPKHLWDNRIHLCRGHFKTYTKDKPLFGSITGRFWWQPTVRGQNKKGVVMKDYELRTT